MSEQYIGNCRICGTVYNAFNVYRNSKIREAMITEHVCSRCASWLRRESDPSSIEEYIDGTLYAFYTQRETNYLHMTADGNSEAYIMRLSDMSVYKAVKVVEIGRPPWKEEIKDTATFITKREFRIVDDGLYECHGTACLDRYTCLFYIKERSEGDTPANRIPEGWKDGDEKCHSYLNIDKVNKHLLKWRKERQ